MNKDLIKSLWWDLRTPGYFYDILLKILNMLPGVSGNMIRGKIIGTSMKHAGVNVQINSGSAIFHPEGMEIGDNFLMNTQCLINAKAGLVVGHNVLIGPGVKIWTINHEFSDKDTPINQQDWASEPVSIGNDVWLGANAIILPGSTIPDGVIIGAASLVTKSIKFEPYHLYAGNPIKKIKSRGQPATDISLV